MDHRLNLELRTLDNDRLNRLVFDVGAKIGIVPSKASIVRLALELLDREWGNQSVDVMAMDRTYLALAQTPVEEQPQLAYTPMNDTEEGYGDGNPF